jgi:hypothetical protein
VADTHAGLQATAALTLRVSCFSLLLRESPALPPPHPTRIPLIKPNAIALQTGAFIALSSIMNVMRRILRPAFVGCFCNLCCIGQLYVASRMRFACIGVKWFWSRETNC